MNKKGSAIITIIAAIVVLLIFALGFISSKTQKTTISKHLSDEKKVEAIAESVADINLTYIKKNSNKYNETISQNNFYAFLRTPLKETGSDKLDVSAANSIDMSLVLPLNEYLKPMVTEFGWNNDNLTINSKCEMISAEKFTPANSEYRVTTIDYEHYPAKGKSAEFLDASIPVVNSNDDTDYTKYAPSNWQLKIKFPSGADFIEKKEFSVSYGVGFWDDLKAGWNSFKEWLGLPSKTEEELENEQKKTEVTLVVNREEKYSTKFKPIEIETENIGTLKVMDELDLQKEMDKSSFYPDEINPKTMDGLRKYIIGDSFPTYEFSKYRTKIVDEYKTVSDLFPNISGDALDTVVEKGAVIRFTTEIEYTKSENNKLKKVLITEIPFKVSDVQPIAPEYTFFIANSKNLLSSPNDIIDGNLGEAIDMESVENQYNDIDDLSQITTSHGKLIVHNMPYEENSDMPLTNFEERIPGMVRINCQYNGKGSKTTEIKSFLGTLSEAKTSELNKFFTPYDSTKIGEYSVNKFNTLVSFLWDDTNTTKRYHEVEFPVLFQEESLSKTDTTITPHGLKGIVQYFKEGGVNLISVPTLLFGNGGMEYPLGICAEGPIKTKYSRCRIEVKPKAKVEILGSEGAISVKDKTEICYDYEQVSTYSNGGEDDTYNFDKSGQDDTIYEPTQYGMQDYKCYLPDETWDSDNDYKYMPANCYDAMQYAKKATRFYENQTEFQNDLKKPIEDGGLLDGTTIKLEGVYYIKDDIELSELTFKGNGIIVAKNIYLSKYINCEDLGGNPSTLGLIARTGKMWLDNATVHAACFSNGAPEAAGSCKIYGNLVCNSFLRERFQDVEIFYNNKITSVSSLASLRKVGKYDPKRYFVAFEDNWTKFVYEKKKD